MTRWPASYAPALLIAGAALLPVVVLVVLAAEAGALPDARDLRLLVDTLLLVLGTSFGAVLLGVPLALLTACVPLPAARLCLVLLAAPLALPSYIGAFTFHAAFGIGGELETVLGLRTPPVGGLTGSVLVMTLYTYPFVLLTTRASLLGQDAHLVAAARTLGLSAGAALRRIVLPRARTGIAAGALLAALYALSDFGTPAIMGFDTFTRAIYVEYNAFGLGQAAALSLQLLLLVALVLFLESRVRATEEPTGRSLVLWPPFWQRALFLTGSGIVVLLALGLPLGVLGIWLQREGSGGFELAYAWNSFVASLLAALAAVLLALPVAHAAGAGRLGRLAERLTYLGFGIPGIVMGTALVYLGLQLPVLYQTLSLLVLAYVLRFLPLAVGTVRSATERMDDRLVQAARSLGAGSRETFLRVRLPLALPGIVAGAALVFLEAMRELPATLLLAPTGFETLATYLWRVYEAGYFGRAAVPGLLLLLMSGAGLSLLLSGERGAAGTRRGSAQGGSG